MTQFATRVRSWYSFKLTQPPIFRNLRGLKYKIENVHPSWQMLNAKRQQFVCGCHISSIFSTCCTGCYDEEHLILDQD